MQTHRAVIPTDAFSESLRVKAIDVTNRRLLMTNFRGSEQERDLSVPPNCEGFGRIRHFRRVTSPGWPPNPLPIDPARRALGLSQTAAVEAQAFQNAACNWRCWYCFVPFELLAAKPEYSKWLSAEELIDLYIREPYRPRVIDLTGGQPDLCPEWVPWMIDAIRSRTLDRKVFLWSDDNLSNDYYFRFLSENQREKVAEFENYGRVCCFKGFDPQSFTFNTSAAPELFDRQLQIFERLLREGIDLYAYATFTTPTRDGLGRNMAHFVDRLQNISEALPLRVVLLEILVFTPVARRLRDEQKAALLNQELARDAWLVELQRRFSSSTIAAAQQDITSVQL